MDDAVDLFRPSPTSCAAPASDGPGASRCVLSQGGGEGLEARIARR